MKEVKSLACGKKLEIEDNQIVLYRLTYCYQAESKTNDKADFEEIAMEMNEGNVKSIYSEDFEKLKDEFDRVKLADASEVGYVNTVYLFEYAVLSASYGCEVPDGGDYESVFYDGQMYEVIDIKTSEPMQEDDEEESDE